MISIICAASFVGIFTCVYFSPDTTWYIWPCAFACIITNIGSIRLAAYLADGIHADLERKKSTAAKRIIMKNWNKTRNKSENSAMT